MNIQMMDMDGLTKAHYRAVESVRKNIPCTEEEADEIVTAIVALVFETLKQYLPGADTCN